MAKPDRKKLEKMKKQDRELSKLPSLDEEKKRFKKGESLLQRLAKKVKPSVSLSKLKKENQKQMKEIGKGSKKK